MSRKAVVFGERMVSTRQSRLRVESLPSARLCQGLPLPGPQEGAWAGLAEQWRGWRGEGMSGLVGAGRVLAGWAVSFPWLSRGLWRVDTWSLLSAGGLTIPKWVHHDEL